jgi:hypothetical protein
MDKSNIKREAEVAREAVWKYKEQLLQTIDGYPDHIDHAALKQILHIVRLEKTQVDDDFRLKICLRKENDQQLLSLLWNSRLPQIFECYICHLETEADTKNLKRFLIKGVPDNLPKFRIGARYVGKYLSFSSLINDFIDVSTWIQRTLKIDGFKFDESEFGSLLHAYSHVPNLWFRDCNFVGFDEELRVKEHVKFQVKWIFIMNEGTKITMEQLKNIFKGMSRNASLVNSLKYVKIEGTTLDPDFVAALLIEFGFDCQVQKD